MASPASFEMVKSYPPNFTGLRQSTYIRAKYIHGREQLLLPSCQNLQWRSFPGTLGAEERLPNSGRLTYEVTAVLSRFKYVYTRSSSEPLDTNLNHEQHENARLSRGQDASKYFIFDSRRYRRDRAR
jgi:hypothetical protein